MLKPAAFVAAVCVLVLIGPIPLLPQLGLRAFITATAVLSLLYLGTQRDLLWATLLGVVAILFNPITNGLRPEGMTPLSIIVHVAAALTLVAAGLRLREEEAPPPPGPGNAPGAPMRAPQGRAPSAPPPQWRKLG